MVHDWLFKAHHCDHSSDNQYSFSDSANILAEALKAIMENDEQVKNYFVFNSVYAAVKTPLAQKRWEEGECRPILVPKMITSGVKRKPPGELIMTIRFE